MVIKLGPVPHGRVSSQKCLSPVSVSPLGVLVASCLSGRLPEIGHLVCPRLLSDYSVLDLRVCEIFHVLFKNSASVSHIFWLSCIQVFKSQTSLGAHLSSTGSLGWGAQYGAQTASSLGRASAILIIFLFVGCPPEGVGFRPCPCCLSCCGCFFMSSCGTSFLPVFRLSSQLLCEYV